MNTGATPDYGIDAPGLLRMFFIAGLASAGFWLAATLLLDGQGVVVPVARLLLVIAAIYLSGMGCLMLYWSKIQKLAEREHILDQIPWHGGEHVLDVGCGRGLMLNGAARRLTTGKAIGVDIWQASDQSANTPEAALVNAKLENVDGKVEVRTADMRALAFPDGAMDVVVSHWAVHNLETEADRSQALAEMVRVLRPGGRLILTDIEHRQAYSERLAALGLTDIRIVVPAWRDVVLWAVSFGSFGPATIYGRKLA